MLNLLFLIRIVYQIAQLLILGRVIVAWVPSLRYHPIGIWLVRTVDPFLRPLQRLVPPWKTGGLDLSPMIAWLILYIAYQIIVRMLLPGSIQPRL